ncbi:hypothetical protein GCM10023166_28860 [Paeniglutamicibacter cryotolerans]|uniref:DNA-binding FadR family transcriptional regulator n=2 Tax=Paeniglutamicibacter cryotolerans TaxID=670079 RepID=A0A839QZX3_9MICC|nr:DNA-binding FadR family transcriptional regulator [Paeniglutamicibacter cryotolerans]
MDERDYDDINDVLGMQRKANDLHSFRSLDSRFHLAIAKATHNDVVYQQMVSLMRELEIARHVLPVDSSEQEIENTLDMHSQTLEAISSRDPDRISEVMSRHLAMMEQAWEGVSARKFSAHAQRLGFTISGDV